MNSPGGKPDEREAAEQRYARRAAQVPADRYSPLQPDVWHTLQERQRALLSLFGAHGVHDVGTLRLTELGCGSGGNLLELLRLGFDPALLQGVELLPERHAQARRVLPAATRLWLGDAADPEQAPVEPGSQHLVLQSTVFSSLLDDAFQQRLADGSGCGRAVRCCGTTSPSTTRATATCAACRWPACGSCFRKGASATAV